MPIVEALGPRTRSCRRRFSMRPLRHRSRKCDPFESKGNLKKVECHEKLTVWD